MVKIAIHDGDNIRAVAPNEAVPTLYLQRREFRVVVGPGSSTPAREFGPVKTIQEAFAECKKRLGQYNVFVLEIKEGTYELPEGLVLWPDDMPHCTFHITAFQQSDPGKVIIKAPGSSVITVKNAHVELSRLTIVNTSGNAGIDIQNDAPTMPPVYLTACRFEQCRVAITAARAHAIVESGMTIVSPTGHTTLIHMDHDSLLEINGVVGYLNKPSSASNKAPLFVAENRSTLDFSQAYFLDAENAVGIAFNVQTESNVIYRKGSLPGDAGTKDDSANIFEMV